MNAQNTLTPGQQAFVPMIQAHREALESLVVPGFLVARNLHPVVEGEIVPFPLEPGHCPECGELYGAPVAQFWAHGRLWRVEFCFSWAENHGPGPHGRVVSAGPEDGLTDGQFVEGMTPFVMTPRGFLAGSQSRVRRANAAYQDLAPYVARLDMEDEQDFEAALEHVLEVALPVRLGYTAGRLGGAESPIQHNHDRTLCPVCEQSMTFLGQLDEDSGFGFADAGACYFLACLDHPEHTYFDAQSH